MANKIIKRIKFLLNPKAYINTIIQEAISKHEKERNEWDLEVPISQTHDDDIFIVGYPKSGNTWMQSIISGLYYGIDTQYLPDRLAQEIIPDVHARRYYKRFGGINFFKSHHLPRPDYKNVIYIVRDGRDALISYYHFNLNLGLDFSLEDMILYGKGLFPSKWHEHLKQWIENPYSAKILFIRYEDLILNPLNEINRLCQFINIERDDEIVKRVIQGTAFSKMKDKANIYDGMGHKLLEGEKGVNFFRSGKIGSYKNEIENRLLDYFDKESSVELKKFNYI